MTSHYFTDDTPRNFSEKSFILRYGGAEFTFITNAGLFSHGEADKQSLFLIKNVPIKEAGEILDLGCGYGLIGVVFAKISPAKITMSDITEKAIYYAEKNTVGNGVKASIIKSDSFENINGPFDIITSNPPIHAGKDVCFKLYSDAAEHLNEGGAFYIVIADKHGAKSHIKKLNEIYKNVTTVARDGGVNVIKCST
jgi:16S rRNA (guanine1207-N2)-methyltransferase